MDVRSVPAAADRRAGHLLFGTMCGASATLLSRAAHWIARQRYTGDGVREPAAGAGEQRDGNGVVRLGQPYEKEFIDDLRDAFDAAMDTAVADDRFMEHGGRPSAGSRVQMSVTGDQFPFEQHVDLGRVFNATVRTAVEAYYGAHFAVVSAKAYRTVHADKEDSGSYASLFRWHMDGRPATGIKLFILLNDVSEGNGPTEYVPRSAGRHAFDTARATTDASPDASPIPVTGEQGTAYLLAPSRVLHRASPVAAGRRRDVMFFRIVPATSPLLADWAERPPYTEPGAERFYSALAQLRSVLRQ